VSYPLEPRDHIVVISLKTSEALTINSVIGLLLVLVSLIQNELLVVALLDFGDFGLIAV